MINLPNFLKSREFLRESASLRRLLNLGNIWYVRKWSHFVKRYIVDIFLVIDIARYYLRIRYSKGTINVSLNRWLHKLLFRRVIPLR